MIIKKVLENIENKIFVMVEITKEL